MNGFNSRREMMGVRVSELEDRSVEFTQIEL